MKPPRRIILGAALFGWLTASAQNVEQDPVLEALLESTNAPQSKPNEVTVVLDPPPAAPAAVDEAAETGEASAPAAPSEPSPRPAPPAAAPEPPADPPEGLEVRVENVRGSQGKVDPSQVKLEAPFPAKPLAQAPAGWQLQAPRDAPPFSREVEISPGAFITLSIRPHLLSPADDGSAVLSVSEPGFEPALGYHQTATVSAVLGTCVENLDKDARQIGDAIELLQQLLVSLPRVESEPLPK